MGETGLDLPARLLASIRSGLVAVDTEGLLVAINPHAERILGCAGDSLGRDCRDVLADQPGVVRALLDALEGRESPSRAELTLEPAAESRACTIGFTVSCVRDERGSLAGATLLFRDLTPLERRDEQERLRERLAALGEMAAGLAHELRNPLASMEVLAGLLKRRLADRGDERQLVEELMDEIRSLAATVTASLEFVKAPALTRASVDPAEILEAALALARARVPFTGAIHRDYEARLPTLAGDSEQLRAVLTNLIVNSLEAMFHADTRDAGSLHLTLHGQGPGEKGASRGEGMASEPERELVIEVRDSGPGIPETLRERIFYPFFTTKDGGSGLGLAMAQKIVVSHGGSLQLVHPREGGVGFRIHLPLDASAELGSL